MQYYDSSLGQGDLCAAKIFSTNTAHKQKNQAATTSTRISEKIDVRQTSLYKYSHPNRCDFRLKCYVTNNKLSALFPLPMKVGKWNFTLTASLDW